MSSQKITLRHRTKLNEKSARYKLEQILLGQINQRICILWALANTSKCCIVKSFNVMKSRPPKVEVELNKEAESSANKLKWNDRIEKFSIKNCFIILKDHIPYFSTKLKYRLITPSKKQMGKLIKLYCRTYVWP